jgi:hypothetical protein
LWAARIKNSAAMVVAMPIITKSTKTVTITCATSITSCAKIIAFYLNLIPTENPKQREQNSLAKVLILNSSLIY